MNIKKLDLDLSYNIFGKYAGNCEIFGKFISSLKDFKI